jgi:NAD(P)-dependent dehydrogenase (short-subunit alcohol dehydrogenase family)
MHGRTALITGSTGGIGWETARGLAALGARVILVGRDGDRAAAATTHIGPAAEWVTADLTCQDEVRRLAGIVASRHDKLDVLVNNFGLNPARREVTTDGVELAFAANVLTPFTLTQSLLPLLRAGSRRVVNLTGGIPTGPIDVENLQGEKRFQGWTFSQYNHSKVALMAMSYEFARTASGITVNVAYPGHAYTPGNRATSASAFPRAYRPVVPLLRLLGPVLLGDFAKAARSSIHLASSPELEGVTGKYFNAQAQETEWPSSVLDGRSREAVWALCSRLVSSAA